MGKGEDAQGLCSADESGSDGRSVHSNMLVAARSPASLGLTDIKASEDLPEFGKSSSMDRVRFLWTGSGMPSFGAAALSMSVAMPSSPLNRSVAELLRSGTGQTRTSRRAWPTWATPSSRAATGLDSGCGAASPSWWYVAYGQRQQRSACPCSRCRPCSVQRLASDVAEQAARVHEAEQRRALVGGQQQEHQHPWRHHPSPQYGALRARATRDGSA